MTLVLDVKGERDITKYFRMTIDSSIPTLWNLHHLNLDRCPTFKLSKHPKAFNWFIPHLTYMFSSRECATCRSREAAPVQDTLLNVKKTLRFLFCSATGLETDQIHTEFVLMNSATGIIYALIFVTDLRLDLAAHTVVADSWVMPGSDDIRHKVMNGLTTALCIKTDEDESEAWKYLLPLFTERCRAWEHKANCKYFSQNSAPLISDPTKAPFCSCGMGVGTEVLRKRYGNAAAMYATRAAISPLFSLSYLEEVGIPEFEEDLPVSAEPPTSGCRACGKEGKPLLACSRCKMAKYCSEECQVRDWKKHKKDCT